jgi:hypothetical protein
MVVTRCGIRLTQHVPLAVLTAQLVGEVALNTQIEHSQNLNRIFSWLEATDYREAFAAVDVLVYLIQLRPEIWKDKVAAADLVAIHP